MEWNKKDETIRGHKKLNATMKDNANNQEINTIRR